MDLLFSSESFGKYALKGYRKWLCDLAQWLPKSLLNYKISLVLRKLTLQNKLKIIDQNILGLKARFYPLDNLFDRHILFQTKYSEVEEFELIKTFLNEDSIFIDIGANTGFYSLLAAKIINQPNHILAFEPNPVMLKRFNQNIVFNQKEDIINVLPVGLANENSEFTLHLNTKNLGSSSIIYDYEQGGIHIKCHPLIDMLIKNQINRIDLLKIDIEGADELVMKHFFDNAPVSLFPRAILIETDDNINFDQHGYKLIKITKSNNKIYLLNEIH